MAKTNVGFVVSLLSLGALRMCAGKLMLGATLDTYPGSSCDHTPSGLVSVTFDSEGKMTFGFQLSGLPESTSGGIHIHAGSTCDDADLVLGHYYTTDDDADPWSDSTCATDDTCEWSSDSEGYAWSTIQLETGYDYDDNNGHAVVWHDAAGSRCGCGLLTPMQPTLTAEIEPYPDYTGDTPKGTVFVKMMADNMHMQYGFALQNLEADTTGGVHIHEGTTCDTADDVGGHWYATDTDIWTDVTWATGASSGWGGKSTSSSIILNSGYGYDDNVGRAVVVHNSAGDRVGCGILKKQDDKMDEKGSRSRLYSLIGGLTKKLQGSASTVQLAGLASMSAAAILAVVAFRMKRATAVRPVPYIATEAPDEEGGLLY